MLAQPSLPFAVGRSGPRTSTSAPLTWPTVRAQAADGCQVLGLRYAETRPSAPASTPWPDELGENFIGVEFAGRSHSTLTEHRQQEGVDRVLAFFEEKLKGEPGPGT